jgi:hypothetical protein
MPVNGGFTWFGRMNELAVASLRFTKSPAILSKGLQKIVPSLLKGLVASERNYLSNILSGINRNDPVRPGMAAVAWVARLYSAGAENRNRPGSVWMPCGQSGPLSGLPCRTNRA